MTVEKYYTVDCRNKFAAFDSDAEGSSEEVILTKAPQLNKVESPHKNISSDKHKERSYNDESTKREKEASPIESASRGSRGGRFSRGGASRNDIANRENTEAIKNDRAKSMNAQRAFRGRGRGGASYSKREYDRRSGDGLTKEKKGGAGGHNWGNQTNQTNEDEKPSSDKAIGDEVVEEVENTVEVVEVEKKEVEMIDLDAYKLLQQAKRANLPSAKPKQNKQNVRNTQQEFEAEGFEKYIKHLIVEKEQTEEENDKNDDSQNRKKKTINVYEYIHNEGGKVKLFNRGRGRDDKNFRGNKDNATSKGRFTKTKTAPNLSDEHAFPKLG